MGTYRDSKTAQAKLAELQKKGVKVTLKQGKDAKGACYTLYHQNPRAHPKEGNNLAQKKEKTAGAGSQPQASRLSKVDPLLPAPAEGRQCPRGLDKSRHSYSASPDSAVNHGLGSPPGINPDLFPGRPFTPKLFQSIPRLCRFSPQIPGMECALCSAEGGGEG